MVEEYISTAWIICLQLKRNSRDIMELTSWSFCQHFNLYLCTVYYYILVAADNDDDDDEQEDGDDSNNNKLLMLILLD